MGLDYRHTCPTIDSGINDFFAEVTSILESILDELQVDMTTEQKKQFIDDNREDICRIFDTSFEDVRKCNQDIRSAADDQIDKIQNDLDDCKYDLEEANEKIIELEDKIEDLECQIQDLKDEIFDLNE